MDKEEFIKAVNEIIPLIKNPRVRRIIYLYIKKMIEHEDDF